MKNVAKKVILGCASNVNNWFDDTCVITDFLIHLSMALADGYGDGSGRFMPMYKLIDFGITPIADSKDNKVFPVIYISADASYDDPYDTMNNADDYVTCKTNGYWDYDFITREGSDGTWVDGNDAVIKNKFIDMSYDDIVKYICDVVVSEYTNYKDDVIKVFNHIDVPKNDNIQSVDDIINILKTVKVVNN